MDKPEKTQKGRFFATTKPPVRGLKENDTVFVEDGIRELFPESVFYEKLGIESYFGAAFSDRSGKAIGHFVLLHDRRMSPRVQHSEVLKSAISNAGRELDRYVSEQERNALKEALAVRKKMQSLGLMAGTIVHEFNNLLAAIIGHTELALLELETDHPAKTSLKIAEENMWRARDVISDLMDFAGNLPKSSAKPVALNDVIERAFALLMVDRENTCRLELDLDADLPHILGQPGQFHQIVTNIALNAFDAMTGIQGTLKVRTAQVSDLDTAPGKCLTGNTGNLDTPCIMLEMSDNGEGMTPETAERVFDPFFSTKSDGRGLGLAGVLGIARRLGAGLTLSSRPGVGTTIRLYFPPAPADSAKLLPGNSAPQKATKPASKGVVLVVDDEADVLATISKQLEKLGYTAIEASSGEQALEIARDHQGIDAAVVDVMMPGIDGWETLQKLRDMRGDLPAVMMSGYNQADADWKGDTAVPTKTLIKPFRMDHLGSCLKNLLALQSKISASP